ncbi:Ubiquitin-conjugating enzyme E2 24 [Actinidia chinensis var. chinensis]|uniref:E2 ubiquitin-conjugating enzyme n=1 Tax=Actinidia chinensis var. chinensis TaxID=1590841 RepID=A0A2R6RAS0_ACTCC|nr:Ubiquitin-conjugating enzyme E2 24 [Actinidia chinensis var. chinensis]
MFKIVGKGAIDDIFSYMPMMDLFSDSDCSSESSSSEELDEIESFYGGQACNILSSLEETIGKIDDFLSFEKEFIHGDIVCSATDPSGQMGRVVNVDMFVDLENSHRKIVKDVNSRRIQKIHSISVGDYVVHGPWLGKVDKIVDRVTILFDDGTKAEFSTMGPEKLLPLAPDLQEDSPYTYYPGQRVRVALSTFSKSARWLRGTWKEKRAEGTVCAVEAGLVYLDWLACALIGCELVPAPPLLQDSKNLTLLSCFSHANWQHGDWCILPASDGDEQIFLDASTCHLSKGYKQFEKVFQERISPNMQENFVIVKTKTEVDVLWQDGSYSVGLDPHSLLPINIVDAHDFWPEQFVLENGTCDDPHVPSGRRWGFVRCVDAKERTVRVKWLGLAANKAIDLEGEQMEETVSAYELVEHPDYSYCLGDVVFQLEKNQLGVEVDGQSMLKKAEVDEEADLKGENCGGEQNVFSNKGYLSCIGIVMGFKDGSVEVKWASGHITKVAPFQIIQMDKYEGSSPNPVLHGENVEQLRQEMTEHDKQSFHPKGKNLLDSGANSLPRAAIGIFTGIVGSLFGSLGSTSLSGSCGVTSEKGHDLVSNSDEDVLESFNLCTEVPATVIGDWPTFEERISEEHVEDTQEEKAPLFSSGSKCPEAFKQFDMVTGCLDHHFVDGAVKGLGLSQVKRGWLKKVQQEWSLLEKDLPETIYVRVYEERMDLLRAAIIGAPGTPYHDGLFFFDIFLPPEYPHEPPLVHYNSGGLRVNPNLYESGKVCLSLLNTWTGTGTEVWNPACSNILQVLLSLQALVLNEKPYYNEAGYDQQMKRAEGEKNSVSYNENAFLVSCRSMLYLLRNPPKHFEAFVEEHFNERAKYILLACKAYMEGAPVGCAFGYRKCEQENQHGSSMGFKIMLSKLLPKLVEAFSDKGIDCSQYADPGI